MPPRKPADVWEAADTPPTPAAPQTPPTTPPSAEKPLPTPTPPGPHTLELRINGKTQLARRIHTYNIDQTGDHITITGNLRPTDA